MKILLLNPLPIYENWPLAGDFWRYMCRSIGVTFPQLAAAVPEHECTIYDAFVEPISYQRYVQLILDFDVIAISVCCPSTALNIQITVNIIRSINPKASIVVGGHHASAYAEQWVKRGADIVITHEGEETFKAVIDTLAQGRQLHSVAGIVFKEQGKIIRTPKREFLTNLDLLPMPRWDLVNFEKYKGVFGDTGPSAFVETSRGCCFSCSFCCVCWMWNYQQRYKSSKRVIDEIVTLKNLGVTTIAIADDNFGSNYKRDMEILNEVVRLELNVNLWMFCRADTIYNHPELIDTAARAGLKEVFVGFEALDQSAIHEYKKNLININAIEKYRKVYEILSRNHVLVLGSFISENQKKVPKANKNISYIDVCDLAMHQLFLPLEGVPLSEELNQDVLPGLDLFYADRFIPVYRKRSGMKLRFANIVKIINGLFNRKLIGFLFSNNPGEQHHKRRVHYIYHSIIECILKISLDKIIVFLWFLLPGISSERKQKFIINRYLGERFTKKILLRAKWKGLNGRS